MGQVFDWDKPGYAAWTRRTCRTIPELARHLAELQLHIKDQAMGPAWMGKKRDFFATLNGIAKSSTPVGIGALVAAGGDELARCPYSPARHRNARCRGRPSRVRGGHRQAVAAGAVGGTGCLHQQGS